MESYRALGFHATSTICGSATESPAIAEFFSDLSRRANASRGPLSSESDPVRT
jgi:3-oxoacyl-(acyl-carrier-protein) synthase